MESTAHITGEQCLTLNEVSRIIASSSGRAAFPGPDRHCASMGWLFLLPALEHGAPTARHLNYGPARA
jgi:hypothetical protein